jgi:hypothetical protein
LSPRTTRRGFVLGSAAIAAQFVASQRAHCGISARLYDTFLYEPRFADARRFARMAGTAYLRDTMLQDPVAQQARRIFQNSSGVAGLTSYADFTVLADVARESGHRLRFHAYHAGESSSHVRCRMMTNRLDADCAEPVSQEREVWERELAATLFGQNIGSRRPDAFRRVTAQLDRRTVHSWLFNRTI